MSSSSAPARSRSSASGTTLRTSAPIRGRRRDPANSLPALEKERAVLLARARRVRDGELAALAHRRDAVHHGAAVLPRLADRVEADVEVRPPVRELEALLPGRAGDPLQRHQTGLARVLPLAHELDDQVAAAHQEIRLAAARASRGSDIVVGKAARADDRRIAHAARHLEEEAAGRGAAGEISPAVHGGEMDGAAALRLAELVPAELLDELLDLGRVPIGLRLQPLVLVREVLLPEQP